MYLYKFCLFLPFGIKVYFMHSHIIFFSPILLENCFSILYVITQVLQALGNSYHQELNRKTDALLLNALSREVRECKCCLYRFRY